MLAKSQRSARDNNVAVSVNQQHLSHPHALPFFSPAFPSQFRVFRVFRFSDVLWPLRFSEAATGRMLACCDAVNAVQAQLAVSLATGLAPTSFKSPLVPYNQPIHQLLMPPLLPPLHPSPSHQVPADRADEFTAFGVSQHPGRATCGPEWRSLALKKTREREN